LGVASLSQTLKEPSQEMLRMAPGARRPPVTRPQQPQQEPPKADPQQALPKSGSPRSQKVTPEKEALEDVLSNVNTIRSLPLPQAVGRVEPALKSIVTIATKILNQNMPDKNDVKSLHQAIENAKSATLPGPRSDATVRGYLEKSKERLDRVSSL